MHVTIAFILAAGLWPAGSALAQDAEADLFAPVEGQQQPAAKPAKPARQAAVKPPKAAPAPAPAADDQRLSQIEAQLADMQVVVGTMELLGRGRGGAQPAGFAGAVGGADLEPRIGRLETQMQALSAQLAEINARLRQMSGQGAAAAGETPLTTALNKGQKPAAGFGTTVVRGSQAPAEDAVPVAEAAPLPAEPEAQVADLGAQPEAPAIPPATPQEAYDLAYGLILQQDYAGAESAFKDFLGRFQGTPLASNAQYWLGQSFYARGQYKPAADAFLKGYKNFRTGQKAPDSLLKVAMSLSRLGQKDTACSAFAALDTEFPNATAQIRQLAQTERDRAACP